MTLLVLALGLLASLVEGQTIAPAHWDYIGPFPVGKTEFDGDPVAQDVRQGPPAIQSSYSSELVPGGKVQWRRVRADGAGRVQINHPAVDWQFLAQTLRLVEGAVTFWWCDSVPPVVSLHPCARLMGVDLSSLHTTAPQRCWSIRDGPWRR